MGRSSCLMYSFSHKIYGHEPLQPSPPAQAHAGPCRKCSWKTNRFWILHTSLLLTLYDPKRSTTCGTSFSGLPNKSLHHGAVGARDGQGFGHQPGHRGRRGRRRSREVDPSLMRMCCTWPVGSEDIGGASRWSSYGRSNVARPTRLSAAGIHRWPREL